MRLHFRCPCGLVLNVAEDQRGSAGECPGCGRIVVVPEEALPTAEIADLADAARASRPKAEVDEAPAGIAEMAASGGAPVPAPLPAPEGDVLPDEPAPEPIPDDLVLEPPDEPASAEAGGAGAAEAPVKETTTVREAPVKERATVKEAAPVAGAAKPTASDKRVDAKGKRRRPRATPAPKAASPATGRPTAAAKPATSGTTRATPPPKRASPVPAGKSGKRTRGATARSKHDGGRSGRGGKEAGDSAAGGSFAERVKRTAGEHPRAAFIYVPAAAVLALVAVIALAVSRGGEDEPEGPDGDRVAAGGIDTALDTASDDAARGRVDVAPGEADDPGDAAPAAPDLSAAAKEAVARVRGLFEGGDFAAAGHEADAALERYADTPEAKDLRKLRKRAGEEAARRKAADDLARDVRKASGLRESGDLEGALEIARSALQRATDPDRRAEVERLVAGIREDLDAAEAARKRAEECDASLAEAEAALEAGRFDDAVAALGRARELGADVDDRVTDARFRGALARAEALLEKGDREEALAAMREALELREDGDLAARADGLERALRLEGLLAEIESSVRSGASARARELLRKLLDGADGDLAAKGRALEARIERAELTAKLLERAEAAAREGRWPSALRAAEKALKADRLSTSARLMRDRAARMIARPPREARSSTGMELVLVPAGRFIMGTDDGPEDAGPSHQVKLAGFDIGAREVTNARFEEFRPDRKGTRDKHSKGDDCPAANVSWDDAVAFCRWLTEKEGVLYRLPTEAEWERAALGDGASVYPWGDEPPLSGSAALANFFAGPRRAWRRDGFMYAAPVGSFPDGASACGALDMAGNVSEWCADRYGASYYGDSPDAAPAGPEEGSERVVRGGSWQTPLKQLSSMRRDHLPPGTTSPAVGFRVARDLFPE